MKLSNILGKPILDISSPMRGVASLRDHFYRRAYESNMTESHVLNRWNAFSSMMDSWFTLEELQDDQRLLKNKKLMSSIVCMQLPTLFEKREDAVHRMATAVTISMPYTLIEEFPKGERLCGYHDDLREFLWHLFDRILLDDEIKRIKTLLLSVTKLSSLVKYAEQKILLAGVHQAVGIYWIERKIANVPIKQAEELAIREFWNVVTYRAVNILNR